MYIIFLSALKQEPHLHRSSATRTFKNTVNADSLFVYTNTEQVFPGIKCSLIAAIIAIII